MKLTQYCPITTMLKPPFTLTIVPIKGKCKRTKYSCGYKALSELNRLKLDPAKYFGADVVDNVGTPVALID